MQGVNVTQKVEQKRAKFVQIDRYRGQAGPLQAFKQGPEPGEVVIPEWDENGYPIWNAPLDMVRHCLTVRKGTRYKLYQSDPIQCPVADEHGAIQWRWFYPWVYDHRTVQVDDPENPGQKTHVWRDFWREDRSGEHKINEASAEVVVEGERAPAPAPQPQPKPEPKPEPKAEVKEHPEDTEPHEGPAGEPSPKHPEPSTPKSNAQVLKEARAEAAEVIGEDEVKRIEKEYRARIRKKSGSFNKKQHFHFLSLLKEAVEAAT